MKLHLAQVCTHPTYTINSGGGQDMNLYLAGLCVGQTNQLLFENSADTDKPKWNGWKNLCALESFYYAEDNKYFPILYENGADLLIDSGAFTFIQNSPRADWDAYIEQYAEFINLYKIEKFFELDIDKIVGLKEVRRLTAKLESLTGKQAIPVWHVSRGKDDFLQMCKDYKYAAVGGYVSKDVPRDKFERAFPWLINEAHKAGCKLHGLGYTPLDISKRAFKFDSVDSTSWVAGNRFGHVYLFDPCAGVMKQYHKPKGTRVKNLETAWHNFNEWVKFQQYLKTI